MRTLIDDVAHRYLRRHRHRHEGGADRRVRRHGLHHRQVSATGALLNLLGLIATFYLTAALFVVRGARADRADRRVLDLQFLAYIKDELLIVLGTSSSESALPQLMEKLERLGCSKSVVGLVVPTGYSFNLDGTNIYMTLATLFIAQALGFDLTCGEQIDHPGRRHADLEGRLRRHRRRLHHAGGDAGRGRSARWCRAWPSCLGIDKFMSECRALTNIIGNGVATVVVSWWEGELDRDKLRAALHPAVAQQVINPGQTEAQPPSSQVDAQSSVTVSPT